MILAPSQLFDIRRSLFQWSGRKCTILLPCQNSLPPTAVQYFFIPILLTFLRCFLLILQSERGTGSTMMKDGEYLTRAWCLSIEIEKTSTVWWAFGCFLFDRIANITVRYQQEKLVPLSRGCLFVTILPSTFVQDLAIPTIMY